MWNKILTLFTNPRRIAISIDKRFPLDSNVEIKISGYLEEIIDLDFIPLIYIEILYRISRSIVFKAGRTPVFIIPVGVFPCPNIRNGTGKEGRH